MGINIQKTIPVVIIILFIIIGSQLGIAKAFGLYLLLYLVYFLYKMYLNREIFILNMKLAESKLFGKPLDKDLWDKDELKNKKIKVVWKKPKTKRAKNETNKRKNT